MPDVTVHFATNRDEIVVDGKIVGFGKHLHAKSPLWIRYGAAEMTPPKKKNDPHTLAGLRVEPESIPGVTAGTGQPLLLGSEALFDGLRRRLIKNKADLVLLLHGFACTFENALSNAAELKSRWGAAGLPLEVAVFCWPADGEITPFIKYASDRDDARSSAKAVARTLMRFVEYLRSLKPEELCGRNIHLVAHSMGNYALRHALQAMLSDIGTRPLPRVFKNIFLMAADEDDNTFEDKEKLLRLPEMAEAVHVYMARNDGALAISDITKGNPDRLGASGPRTLTSLPHKVVLVDCTDVSGTSPITDVRHQYYRKRAEVIADIRQVLAGIPAEAVKGREWVASRRCFRIAAAE